MLLYCKNCTLVFSNVESCLLNKIFSICTGDVVTESMDMTHLVVFMRKKSEIDFFKETAAVKKI